MSGIFKKIESLVEKGKEAHAKTWHNWAGNIVLEPELIFHPKSLNDLQEIVKKAKKHGKKIRCVSEGHSWSTLSVTKDYLVIVRDMHQIQVEKSEKYGWTITAEAGATIKQMDDKLRQHKPPLSFDSMTVLSSVRASGIVATGSHGAKCAGASISDQVVKLQIVTGDGELHVFSDENDPKEMSAARINLGLLGIMYKITWHVQPLFKLRMIDFQPPIKSWLYPATLKEFVEKSDSVEVFYWPFNESELDRNDDKLWVKQWLRTDDPITTSQAELGMERVCEDLETRFGDKLYQFIVKCPESTPYITNLLWKAGPVSKPQNVVIPAPDAIHYQSGIDNILCDDLEFTFKADKDFANVAEEFNHIVDSVYAYAKKGKFPMNLAAEMRILKASPSLLASGYDEDPNAIYCFIEVLAIRHTSGFEEFSAELATRWMKKYKARPHWAKAWEHVPGIKPYLREILGKRLETFESVRVKYDADKIFFDNKSLEEVFYGSPKSTFTESHL
ncbi:11816_t:CDS:2 [Ambispora gerdemannii]|uniref:D-arabinono-1,4-lactone oxidase n=1 Tax=Ambispora gerdemannii TaxID=144530 RepID=A0A9N9A0H4_9GLOM|nr:11816_t:CDS:2 [Ambispora gerdemannii]